MTYFCSMNKHSITKCFLVERLLLHNMISFVLWGRKYQNSILPSYWKVNRYLKREIKCICNPSFKLILKVTWWDSLNTPLICKKSLENFDRKTERAHGALYLVVCLTLAWQLCSKALWTPSFVRALLVYYSVKSSIAKWNRGILVKH